MAPDRRDRLNGLIQLLTARDQDGRGIVQLATLNRDTAVLAQVISFSRRFLRTVGKVCRLSLSVLDRLAEAEGKIMHPDLQNVLHFSSPDHDAAVNFPGFPAGVHRGAICRFHQFPPFTRCYSLR